MTLTKLTEDVNKIQELPDQPNANNGLTASQLKAAFDAGPAAIKAYLNDILTAEIDAWFATKEELAEVVSGQIPDGSLAYTKLTPAPTSEATAGTLALRDADGVIKVGEPSENDDAAQLATVKDAAMVKGDYTNPVPLDSIGFSSGHWAQAIVVGQYAYLWGNSTLSPSMFRYDLLTNTFTQMASPPSGYYVYYGCTDKTYIYATANKKTTNDKFALLRYNITSNTWSTFAEAVYPVTSSASATLTRPIISGNYILAAGSYTGASTTVSAFRIDKTTGIVATNSQIGTNTSGYDFGGAVATDDTVFYVSLANNRTCWVTISSWAGAGYGSISAFTVPLYTENGNKFGIVNVSFDNLRFTKYGAMTGQVTFATDTEYTLLRLFRTTNSLFFSDYGRILAYNGLYEDVPDLIGF